MCALGAGNCGCRGAWPWGSWVCTDGLSLVVCKRPDLHLKIHLPSLPYAAGTRWLVYRTGLKRLVTKTGMQKAFFEKMSCKRLD